MKPTRDNNDPLIYHEGDDYVCLVRHERLLKEVIPGRKEGTATFRVCLGPDLVAEKKAMGGSSIAPAKSAGVASTNNSAPKIVGASPTNGDQAVDAGVGEVVVRFERPMQSGLSLTGFDWPKIAIGEPKWDATMTTLTVMVKLSPKTTYRLGLNSAQSHELQE